MSAPKPWSWGRGERGQVIILFVGVITVIFVIAAIVIDFGLWFAERRAAQRAADLAAAAGAQDLFESDAAAVASARQWAVDNGFAPEEVGVTLLCSNTLADPPAGVCTNPNPPGADPSTCPEGSGCDTIRVEIETTGARLFTSLPFLDVGNVTVGAEATAGLVVGGSGGSAGDTGLDTILLLDASSEMAQFCGQSCRIRIEWALDAALDFVDMAWAAGSSVGRMGYAAYNYCYYSALIGLDPMLGGRNCIPDGPGQALLAPTDDAALARAAIDSTPDSRAELRGTSTNQCLPLLKALAMVAGRVGGPRPAVVFLSDGDNSYRHGFYFDQVLHYPPIECRTAPARDTEIDLARYAAECDRLPVPWLEEQEWALDKKTWEVGKRLRQYADIYVIALDPCGPDDGRTRDDPGYCNGIGDGLGDRIADQRLLKCIATSPEHYFPVASGQELPETFAEVAAEIAGRALLQ